jgi:predicted transcriptional regulator
MVSEPVDTEFIILENIYDSSTQAAPLRQRDMAHVAGASLGMTNAILKRLAKKGWISVKKLNNRNIQYAVTLYAETIPLLESPGQKNRLYLSRMVIEKTAEGR